MSEIADLWRTRMKKNAVGGPIRLELPSGMPVMARRVDLHALFGLGEIPDTLTPIVTDWFATKAPTKEAITEALVQKINEHLADYYRVLNYVWRACIVEPQFWETVEEAIAHPDWLPMSEVNKDDRQFFFDWCQGIDETFQQFFFRIAGRPQQPGPSEGEAVELLPGREGDEHGLPAPVRDRPEGRTVAGDPGAPDAADVRGGSGGEVGPDGPRTVHAADSADAAGAAVHARRGASALEF